MTDSPPAARPTRGVFTATVAANDTLCREHYRLTLDVPGLPESAPGQFVQVECRDESANSVDHEFEWTPGERPTIAGREFLGHEAFLRRPFSIAGRRGDAIDLIGREVGVGTRFLSRLKVGDRISVVGPLGNRFKMPEANGIALLVGGGVGIPPMIYVAQHLAGRGKAIAFAGALTRDLMALTVDDGTAAPSPHHNNTRPQPLYNVREFADYGVPALLTTDDGTLGRRGYVTDALEAYLDAWITDNADRNRATIYTCGPEPMMKRVQAIGAKRGVAVQIAVERAMACGMGTCQSCCIRVKKPDSAKPPLAGSEWCYRLACTDGPVFEGESLLW